MRASLVFLALAACSDSPVAEPDWMARESDTRGLAELSIPGTHDSGARFEPYPSLAKCQDLAIAEQLDAGIRYFDLRLRNFDDQFLIYHGSVDQNLSFDDVLAAMSAFLDAHPHEVVIASVKEELDAYGATLTFEQLFAQYVARDPARWYLGDTVPTLGQARGKIVLLRRFDVLQTPLGLDASPWPDNMSFAVANAAAMRIEDEYMVAANDAKWAAITANVDAARAGDPATLFLTYTSGYQMIGGLPNITMVSDDINRRLDTLVADPAPRRLGVLVMDHVIATRARAVIDTN